MNHPTPDHVTRYVQVQTRRLSFHDILAHMRNRGVTIIKSVPVTDIMLTWYVELSAPTQEVIDASITYLHGLKVACIITQLTQKPAELH